ncbi:BamA/TamA family outer membrane protein [Bacteroidota bacterium]
MKKFITVIMLMISTGYTIGQENGQFELVKVDFVGNENLSTSDLEDLVSSKESPGWFSQFLYSFSSFGDEAIFFDSTYVQSDVDYIRYFYWANGYFEVDVSAEYVYDFLDNEVELIFLIDEGPVFYFKKMHKRGLDSIPAHFLEEIEGNIQIDSTEKYSDLVVSREIAATINSLRDRGYMLIDYEQPIVNVDTLANNVEIITTFNPGLRYKISDILVNKTGVGRNLVDDELLREIVDVQSGSYYSYYALRRGQIRLYRTNLFSSALVTAITADTIGATVPVVINTDVGLVHELSPELIVNNEDNAFNLGLGIGFQKKNFFGDARKLTISASSAAQNITDFLSTATLHDTTIYGYADARIILDQQTLFNLPINTKLETYITLQKRKQEYNAKIYGTKLSLDIEMPQHTYITSLISYLNWENSKYIFRDQYIHRGITNYYTRELGSIGNIDIDSLVQEINKTSSSTNAVIGVEIDANRSNDLLLPTRGYRISIQLEDGNTIPFLISKIGSGNFNNPRYYKVVFNASAYLPIYSSKSNSAFGLKFKTGIINTYEGDKFDIPLNQRFYSGGSNSVRGWRTRELVPANPDIALPENPTSEEIESIFLRGVTPGGFFIFEGSIESRNRLSGILGSAIFIDFGNTWDDYRDFNFNRVAVAAGFGFRLYSDFAPIRVDFGFKIYDPQDKRSFFSKKTLQETFEFHLGIGEAF